MRFAFADGEGPGWFHLECAAICYPVEVERPIARWSADRGRDDIEAALARRRDEAPGGPVELESVVQAAERRDWPTVLAGVLQAWRASRDVRLARLASALTDDAVREVGGIPTGPRLEAFTDGLDPTDPVQRGLLIRASGRAKKRAMPQLLGRGVLWPLDPRWVDLVLPWFETPPWRDAGGVWLGVLAIANRTVDSRLEEALDRLRYTAPLPMGAMGAHWVRDWLVRHPEGALARRRAGATPLTDEHLAQLEAIVRSLSAARSTHQDEAAQTAALYRRAAEGDDAALLVLADRLLAVDDIRGEFIQLSARDDRAGRSAARALQRGSWRALLGPLAPVVYKRGLTFERGLPTAVVASSRKPADIESVQDCVEWASVRSLHLTPPAGHTEAVLGLITPAQTGLRTIRATVSPAGLARLLSEGAQLPSVRTIEVIAPWTGGGGGVLSIPECRFPNLSVLVLPPDWGASTRAQLRAALPGVDLRLARL